MKYLNGKWLWVTAGGATGMLFEGVGAAYAPDAIAAIFGKKDINNNLNPAPESMDSQNENGLPVADVNDDMPFKEAFATAREEVGPGGVFYWHGGIYGTYYKEEWDAMSAEEKSEFGSLAMEMFPPADNPENAVKPQDVAELPEEQEIVNHETEEIPVTNEDRSSADNDVPVDPELKVISTGSIDGHLAAEVDVDGDGKSDYILIDADDSKKLSEKDIAVDREGNMTTMKGENIGNVFKDDTEKTANTPDHSDDEVAIVGYGEYDGHMTVGYDTSGDGETDVVIIDVDDDGRPSADDVVVYKDGRTSTIGEMDGVDSADNIDEDAPDDNSDDFINV